MSPTEIRRAAAAAFLFALLAASAQAADKKKGGGETFIQLPTLTATVFQSGGARGVLTVDVGVDVPDGRLRQKAALSAPRLRDAFTQKILTYAASLPPSAPPNPDAIGASLQAAADETLGAPGARVLLGSIMIN